MIKHLLALLFSLLFFLRSTAQIDTSFWFVAPKVPTAIGINSVSLQFGSYSQSVTIRVRQPANAGGVNLTFTLAANSATMVNMTASQALITSTLANTAANKGLYISSTDIVSANYIIESNVGQESISLKGTNSAGTDFYTPFVNSLPTASTGAVTNVGFDIVATESGTTTLLITPRANLAGPRTKDITFSTQLTQGQTFSCQESVRGKNPYAIVAKDFNNDLNVDVAVVDQLNNLLFIFTNNGTGVFTEQAHYDVGSIATKVLSEDVNADGNADLVVINSNSNNFYVFLGAGNGTFAAPVTYTSGVGSRPLSGACSDINGDSFKDLVVVNNLSDNVSVFLNNGSGGFTFSSTYTAAALPTDVAIADFNNNGVIDLAVTNSGSNNVSIIYGITPGTFSVTPLNIAVGTTPAALIVADFDGNSRLDIAVANRGSNNVSVLLGDPATTFSAAVNYATASTPVSLVTTTVDAGPSLDLVVANYGSASISVLTNNTGTFAAAVNNGMAANPNSLAFADFNNDGIQDFVTANFTANNFSRRLGAGTATLAAVVNTPFGNALPTLLAGSIVSADQKVTVTISGASQSPTSCPSFYADQVTNSSVIGKDHVIHKSAANSDVVYVLATVNSTSITATSATANSILINTGETFTVNTASAPLTHIVADKPVYVLSASGDFCKNGAAQIAPAYCAGSYTAGFTRINSDSLFLQIYTRNGYQSTFTLEINTVPSSIAASNFTVVPGSGNNLVGARIYYNTTTVPVGAYCVLKNSADIFGLSVMQSSTARGVLFSQASNFSINSFVFANPVSTATICSNTQFTLNGVVGGGPITGVWSTNGFGTFSGGNSQLTNNIYIPNPVDTNISPLKMVLTSTGICPNKSDTLKLTVKQGPIVSAGSDAIVCSNNPTLQLTGNVFGATNQGVWSVVAPGSGTFTSGVNTFTPNYVLSNADTALTQLRFVITSINNAGCNAESDTVNIVINKAPIVTASQTNPIITCANNATVFLNGTVSGTTTSTGKWTTLGSGIFVPNNLSLIANYIPSPADITSGSTYIRLESTNNLFCNAVLDSVQILYTQPSQPNVGTDLNSCKNNAQASLSVAISGTAASTGIWLGGNGSFVPSNTALTNTYYATPGEVAAGFVILTFSTTNNGLCAANSDQLKITFQDKPTANFTVSSVCLHQATFFSNSSLNTSGVGSLASWSFDLGDGTDTTGTDFQNRFAHTYALPGTYTAQLIVKNTFDCYDTVSRPLVVYGLPTASMSISRACSGSAQLITFQDLSTIAPPDNIPATGYYWDFGGQGFSISQDTSIIFPSEGIYGITHVVSSDKNCQSVVTQSVNITPKPKARFKIVNNSSLSLGATISFLDSSNIAPSSWHWTFGNGDSSNIKNPTTTYSANGTYTVSLTIADQFGCTDTFTASVNIKTIAGEITQLIPNMITPNGDGKNDVWRLDFINVYFPTAEIEIYSRWGERLFRSIGYSNAWDGSYKGDPLPVGAYFYIIKLNNQENQIYKGTVTLLK